MATTNQTATQPEPTEEAAAVDAAVQAGKVTKGPTKVARGAKTKQRKTTTEATEASVQVTKGPTKVARGTKTRQRVTGRAKRRADARLAKPNGVAAKSTKATKAKAKAADQVNPPRAKDDFQNDQTITLAKKKPEDKQLLERFKLMKSGMTVGDAIEVQKPLRRRRGLLRKLIEGGFVVLK